MLVQSLYFSHKIYFPLTNFKFPVWTSHSSWKFYIPHANFVSLEQCLHFFDTKLTSKANGLKRYIFFFPLGTYLLLSYDLRDMCPWPVAGARRTFPALSRHFVRLLRKLPTSHELTLMRTTIGLFKFPPPKAKVVYKCPTQALELIFNFLVKSKISTLVTVTFLWTLFSELSAHASDFFFLKRLHTEIQNTFIPLERLAGSGSNSPPRLKFYFRERATVKFPWVSRRFSWSMASWKLIATPSFNELSTYVYCFLLLSVCFLNSFLQQLCDGLKKLPTFWWKRKHGWNVNALDMFDVWFSIFLNSLCDSLDTIIDREIKNGLKL